MGLFGPCEPARWKSKQLGLDLRTPGPKTWVGAARCGPDDLALQLLKAQGELLRMGRMTKVISNHRICYRLCSPWPSGRGSGQIPLPKLPKHPRSQPHSAPAQLARLPPPAQPSSLAGPRRSISTPASFAQAPVAPFAVAHVTFLLPLHVSVESRRPMWLATGFHTFGSNWRPQTANSRSPHVHNTPESSCPLDLKLVLGVLADPQLRRSGLEVDLSRKQGRCHPRSLVALDSVIPKERRNPCLPSLTHPVACVKATCSADGRYLPNLVFRVPHTLEDFILQHQSLAKHQQTLHCWQPLGGVP